MHSGKAPKHSGKPSPRATLGEEPPGMPLTGKRPSPSAKNHTLGEAFPECHPPPRGRFNTVGVVSLFLLFPECNTRGRNFLFFYFETSSPSATLGEEIHFSFFKTSSPSAHAQALGEAPFVFFKSLPRVPNAQALGEAPCPFF
jgi:hypothetical protein